MTAPCKHDLKKLCISLKKHNYKFISTGSTCKKIKSLGFDCIEISKITQFEEFLLEKLRSNGKQILDKIEKEKALSESLEVELKKFLEDNTKMFLEENNAKS